MHIFLQFIIIVIIMQKSHQIQNPSFFIQQFIIITILFFITPAYSQQCTKCIDLNYYHCVICYDYCTTDTTKQFQSCQYNYCTFLGLNTTSNCFIYQTAYLPIKQCYQTCCNLQQDYFTVDSVNKCSYINTTNLGVLLAVTIGLTGFCVLFTVCCIFRRYMGWSCGFCRPCELGFYGCCHKLGELLCCKCCRNQDVQQNSQQAIPRSGSSRSLNSIQLIQSKPIKLKWQKCQPNKLIKDTTLTCIICLGNQINTLTYCNHYYHLQCIIQWYLHSNICPLCKNKKNMQIIKYYCNNCSQFYIKIDILKYRNYGKIKEYINEMGCMVCR